MITDHDSRTLYCISICNVPIIGICQDVFDSEARQHPQKWLQQMSAILDPGCWPQWILTLVGMQFMDNYWLWHCHVQQNFVTDFACQQDQWQYHIVFQSSCARANITLQTNTSSSLHGRKDAYCTKPWTNFISSILAF
jgi:hypothetical protein